MQVQSLGWEDPLEEGMATHSQYSCLKNPMDRRAWQVLVHRVANGQIEYVCTCVRAHTHTHTYTYDPAIPLLGFYPEKDIIQKDICTLMFISALSTIAKMWK